MPIEESTAGPVAAAVVAVAAEAEAVVAAAAEAEAVVAVAGRPTEPPTASWARQKAAA